MSENQGSQTGPVWWAMTIVPRRSALVLDAGQQDKWGGAAQFYDTMAA